MLYHGLEIGVVWDIVDAVSLKAYHPKCSAGATCKHGH